MALNLPNNGDSILGYDIEQTNDINDIVENLILQRIVNDSDGWTVLEYKGGFTRMIKTEYDAGISFNAVTPLFARTINRAIYFPYPLTNVKSIEISPLITPGTGINAWVDNIVVGNSSITAVRWVSLENRTRDMRYSIVVEGFR